MAVSNEEKMLKERIRHLLTSKRASVASLADNENERVRLRHQINDDALVQYSTLYKLLYMFHDIDANWLILGEGQMQKTADHPRIYNHNEANGSSAGGSIYVGTSTIPYPVQALLEEKDKRIAELEKDKTQLQGLLSVFTSQAEAVTPKKKMKNSDAD
jgi:hypothetical protein